MTVDSTLTICSACRVRRRWTAYQCREGEMAACMHACMCRVRYWFARLLLTWPLLALDYNYSWRYCMRVNFDCYPDPDIVPYNFLSRHTTHMPHHAHAPSCPITHMPHYTPLCTRSASRATSPWTSSSLRSVPRAICNHFITVDCGSCMGVAGERDCTHGMNTIH